MKRFGACAISLGLAVTLWAASAGAQEKLVMGMAGGT